MCAFLLTPYRVCAVLSRYDLSENDVCGLNLRSLPHFVTVVFGLHITHTWTLGVVLSFSIIFELGCHLWTSYSHLLWHATTYALSRTCEHSIVQTALIGHSSWLLVACMVHQGHTTTLQAVGMIHYWTQALIIWTGPNGYTVKMISCPMRDRPATRRPHGCRHNNLASFQQLQPRPKPKVCALWMFNHHI